MIDWRGNYKQPELTNDDIRAAQQIYGEKDEWKGARKIKIKLQAEKAVPPHSRSSRGRRAEGMSGEMGVGIMMTVREAS
jgi:hypothetical protein